MPTYKKLDEIDTDLIRKLQRKGCKVSVDRERMRESFNGALQTADKLRQQAYSSPRRSRRLLGFLLSLLTLGAYPRG
jgi:hypothetical protein